VAQLLGFRQVCFAPPQIFLGSHPTRNIHHGPNELKSPAFPPYGMCSNMDGLHGAIRHKEAMLKIEIAA
jgi:hypothetical protein